MRAVLAPHAGVRRPSGVSTAENCGGGTRGAPAVRHGASHRRLGPPGPWVLGRLRRSRGGVTRTGGPAWRGSPLAGSACALGSPPLEAVSRWGDKYSLFLCPAQLGGPRRGPPLTCVRTPIRREAMLQVASSSGFLFFDWWSRLGLSGAISSPSSFMFRNAFIGYGVPVSVVGSCA